MISVIKIEGSLQWDKQYAASLDTFSVVTSCGLLYNSECKEEWGGGRMGRLIHLSIDGVLPKHLPEELFLAT